MCIEVIDCPISECFLKDIFQGIASGLCVLNGMETVPIELTVGEYKLLLADRHTGVLMDDSGLSL